MKKIMFNDKYGLTKAVLDAKERKKLCSLSGLKGGLNNPERSMISPDYARNFICDFIIGKHKYLHKNNCLINNENWID